MRQRDWPELDLRGPVGHTGSLIFIHTATKINKGFLMGQQKTLSNSGNRSVWVFCQENIRDARNCRVMAGTMQASSDGGCIPGCGGVETSTQIQELPRR